MLNQGDVMKKNNQTGFGIIEALLIMVVVGILGFTGWYAYHSRSVANKDYNSASTDSQVSPDSRYVSYGAKGRKLASKTDVAKLTGAGGALKQYFDANVGLPVQDPATFGTDSTSTVPQTFTVSGVYGNYAIAEGNSDDFESILGPQKNGSVGVLVGTQDEWSCSKLTAAHVSAILVGSKCADSSGKVVSYKG